jgi:stage II sporulation protein D
MLAGHLEVPLPARPHRSSTRRITALAPVLMVAAMIVALAAAPAPVHGVDPTPVPTTTVMVTACEGVNVRTSAATTAAAKAKLPINTSVTVVATVSGGSWSTTCGTSVSGSSWLKISHVNGRSTSSLYGVAYVYGASKLFRAAPAATTPATGDTFGGELMRLVNLDRQALGLAPMLVDPGLANIARDAQFTCPTNAKLVPRGRAADMAARSYFAHTVKDCRKADGTLYGAVEITKSVFGYTGARSEILHWNSYAATASTYALGCDLNGANCKGGTTPTPYTVRIAQRSFMSSSVHRAAQLGAYERFGCGTATVPGTSKSYFACLFSNGGSTMSASSPTPAPTATPTPTATPAPTATATPAPTASATPAPTPATTTMLAKCEGVNLRTSASTSATIKAKIALNTPVTVAGTVSGSSWSTVCGTSVSGASWYRLTHVNGKTVSSLYGVASLYAATGVLKAAPTATPSPTPAPTATPTPTATPAPTATATPAPTASATPAPTPATTTMLAKCEGVNLRTSASTSATIKAKIALNTPVTVAGTVSGSSWSTVCGTSVSGASWYRLTHVNGKTVSSLYGVASLYAATGVLKAAPTATPAPTATNLTPIGASTTFSGRGWGHGVGMSQHGARGRALDGQNAGTILAHYYRNTTFGKLPTDTPIRVLVLDSWAATGTNPLTIHGRAGAWTVDGIEAVFPADARLRAIPAVTGTSTTWRLVVNAADGTILHDGPAGSGVRVRPADDATQLQLLSKGSTYDRYRGVLRVLLANRASVINELSMEAYLRGVVPAEMPSSYPFEALRAQAVAARSYAAYRLRPGTGTFDVYDDTRSQVYRGIRRETAATNSAVEGTAGTVLRYGTGIANTLYHSTGGGATEHNENVFTSSTGAKTAGVVAYLRGSSDRRADGTAYDAAAPYATWSTGPFTQAQLSAIFGADARTNVGTITGLGLTNRGVSGRLVSVTLVGSTATRTVSGNVFVSVFNAKRPAGAALMRSSLVDVKPIP